MKNFKGIIEKKILSLGFDKVGFCRPEVDHVTKRNYLNFLNKKYHGDMDWLEKHYEKKIDPKKIWPEVKTILVQGTNYSPSSNPIMINKKKTVGNISAYAKNEDYHKVLKNSLLKFKTWLSRKYSIDSLVSTAAFSLSCPTTHTCLAIQFGLLRFRSLQFFFD